MFIGSCTAHPDTCDVLTKLPRWYSIGHELEDFFLAGGILRYGEPRGS